MNSRHIWRESYRGTSADWVEGATRGRQLPKTSREKELAKELAANLTRERVEVVADVW